MERIVKQSEPRQSLDREDLTSQIPTPGELEVKKQPLPSNVGVNFPAWILEPPSAHLSQENLFSVLHDENAFEYFMRYAERSYWYQHLLSTL